jgi:hypothetical protein
MGALNNLYVSSSFQGLMKLTNSATGLTNTLQTIQAGDGSDSPLQMSLTQMNISGSFTVNNLPITGSTSGTAGTSGTSGTSGSSGSDGTSGTSGSSGSAGTSGTSGSSGTSGTSGSSGTSGTSGSNGSSGTSGSSGSSGTTGTSGSSGSSGTTGTSGSSGSDGTSGSSGSDGTSGTSGSSGSDGSSGTSGTSGSSGSTGTSGSSGSDGTSGSNGTDGTSGTSGVSPSLVGLITTGSFASSQAISGAFVFTMDTNNGDEFKIIGDSPSINIGLNTNNSGSQYPNINVNLNSVNYFENVFGGYSINDVGTGNGIALTMNTYTGVYSSTPNEAVAVIGGGGDYSGDNTAIGFRSGSIDFWKPTIFKRGGVNITGSLNVTGGITGSIDKTGLITTGSATTGSQTVKGDFKFDTTYTGSYPATSQNGGSNIFYADYSNFSEGSLFLFWGNNNWVGITVNGPGVTNATITSINFDAYYEMTLSSGTVTNGATYTFTGPAFQTIDVTGSLALTQEVKVIGSNNINGLDTNAIYSKTPDGSIQANVQATDGINVGRNDTFDYLRMVITGSQNGAGAEYAGPQIAQSANFTSRTQFGFQDTGNFTDGRIYAYQLMDMKSGSTITGSLRVTGGITGSLQGTSSFATTASFALNTNVNRDGLITTGSNSFPQQNISGSLIINGGSNTADSLRITGSILLSGSFNNMNIWRGPNDNGTNTALGFGSLENSISGTFNTALGGNTLQDNISGSNNIAIGSAALFKNLASQNTAIGANSLEENTTGRQNLGIGAGTLSSNKTGIENVAIGYNTLLNNISGSANIGIGPNVLPNNIAGGNIAIGGGAMSNNTLGSNNIVLGGGGLVGNTTGNQNISLGFLAGLFNQTGSNNITIGSYAGFQNTSNKQLFIGSEDFGSVDAERSGSLVWGQMNSVTSGQTLQFNAATNITNNLVVSGSLSVGGNLQFNVGDFYSTQTQSGSANVSGSVTYNNTGISNGVTLASNSRLTIANSGVYSITFSAQLKEVGGTDTIYLWLKKNGTNVADTGTKTVVRNNDENIMTVEYIVQAAANDYYEIVFQNVNGHAQLYYEAASGNIPATPSIITTVKQVR